MNKLFTCILLLIFIGINNNQVRGAKPVNQNSSQLSTTIAITKPGLMVVRIKPAYRSVCSKDNVNILRLKDAMVKISSSSITKKFPRSGAPEQKMNKSFQPLVDLSLIYQISFSPVVRLEEAIKIIKSTGVVEYAEPLYIHHINYIPNDPSAAAQYALTKINAYGAWDVLKGDTNVVIGIVDTGTDWDHPDLQANVKYNYADPIDGLDNDSDGFVDNFRGWDVSENDNDPMVVSETHGSHVSGCAAAVTDNGVGVASPGFNCKFLPVKSSFDASSGSIDNGYEGITYAADHGANVINCSWSGSAGTQFEQDIINYATINKDALVIAAAGNNGIDTYRYPASYDNVISVAATNGSDVKAGFSNYGGNIDVCAPGVNILSTIHNDTYTTSDGTSMASPIAAGCAAMIKSRFPSFNALQVGEQLRVTCDNIYGIPANAGFANKLGKGRVNLFKAVTDSVSPGVALIHTDIKDGNDNLFISGDTINVVGLFQNLLRPILNLTCTLSTSDPNVQVIQSNFNAGNLSTLDTISNFNSAYRFLIIPGTPANTEVDFIITLTDGSWSDVYGFKVVVNVDYINISINNVATSITSKSLIGYNQTGQAQGLGFTYKEGETMLYDMGLMVGVENRQVSDNVRASAGAYDSDFAPWVTVSSVKPGVISDFDVNGVFKDNGLTSSAPLDVLVSHHAYAWVDAPHENYIMVQYYITNNSANAFTNLYAGLCADWDIPLYSNNKCSTDVARKMGYVWSTDLLGLYGGIKLLSHNGGFNHYGFDNVAGGGGGIDLTDAFINTEKFTSLSTSRLNSGNINPTGNDVLSAVSTGPFNVSAGDSLEVTFALIAGESLSSIQASADAAQAKYDSLFVGIISIGNANANELSQSFPNPAYKDVRINVSLKESNNSELSIYNLLGVKVMTILNEKIPAGRYSVHADVSKLPAGNYFYRLTSGNFTATRSLVVIH